MSTTPPTKNMTAWDNATDHALHENFSFSHHVQTYPVASMKPNVVRIVEVTTRKDLLKRTRQKMNHPRDH
jgi:hypothetical protein